MGDIKKYILQKIRLDDSSLHPSPKDEQPQNILFLHITLGNNTAPGLNLKFCSQYVMMLPVSTTNLLDGLDAEKELKKHSFKKLSKIQDGHQFVFAMNSSVH